MSIKTSVIGHPISHSKSPLIHNYWIEKHGLDGNYEAIDIAPDDLDAGVKKLVEAGYAGFNVTVPHKIAIMDLCDEIDGLAKSIGAVNTVVIKEGKLYGTNTDAYGFIQNIKRSAPNLNLSEGKVVILGAGGATKAALYALIEEGTPQIIITNRTIEKAQELAAISPNIIKVADWEKRSLICTNADLIVNTTSLGMVGAPALEIDISKAAKGAVIADIVYAPLETELLKQAQEHGFHAVTGIGMLLHQARPAFEKWYSVVPEVTPELEELVLA